MKKFAYLLFATAIAMVPILTGPTAASAGQNEITVTNAGPNEIDQEEEAPKSDELQEVVDDFMTDQAREGNPIDAADIESAAVDEAFVVWEDGVEIERVQTATVEEPGDDSVELATIAGPAEETEANVSGSGLGTEGMTDRHNGQPDGGYCTTTVVANQSLTQCFERIQIVQDNNPNRKTYFYNRWATAVGQQVSGQEDWKPRKIDIRSRPWLGYRGDFSNLLNYWPRSTSSLCVDKSYGVSVFGFGATIPVSNCEDITPSPDATSITMMNVWDGGIVFDQRSEGVDFSMSVQTFNKPAPMGDYGYAKFCHFHDGNCEGVLRKEGWN